MDLQEKLIELSEYNVSFNVANGSFVIRIKYDDRWTVIQPDSKDISFYRDDSNDSVYYYVAPITVGIDKMFSAIDETIEYNRELEIKVELFKQKMNELQEIFAQEPLEVLNTLEFKMKKKRDKIKKSKQTEIEKEVSEENESVKDIEKEDTVEEEKETEIDKKISELIK